MSNKTNVCYKAGICMAVVNNLRERGIKTKQMEYLKSIEDVDKAYIIANRYVRNYIPLNDKKDKKEFSKGVERFSKMYQKRGGKWLVTDNSDDVQDETKKTFDNDLVKETDEMFVERIEETDRSNKCIQKSGLGKMPSETKLDSYGKALITLAVEKGVNKFSKKFLDLIGIEKEFVGYRDDVELYYCKSVNSIFEIV